METERHKELVSIITPTYNSARFIKETIQSVQLQTYQNWELIIVDDCSNDSTVTIVEEAQFLDNRIKLLINESNSGAAISRNKAIKHASGRYLAFLDSDDQWLPQKLEKQVEFMQKRDIPFSFTKYRIMTETGEKTNTIINIPDEVDYNHLLKNTIIGCLTVMLDTQKVGFVQMPNIKSRQDTALWLSILREGHKAYGLQEVLANYRKVKGSISSNKVKAASKTWFVYRKIEKLNFVYASWCFLNYAWNAYKKSR